MNFDNIESLVDHYSGITADMLQRAKFSRSASFGGLYTAAINFDDLASVLAILGLDVYNKATTFSEDTILPVNSTSSTLTLAAILGYSGWSYVTFRNKLRGYTWGRWVKENHQLKDGMRIPRKTFSDINLNDYILTAKCFR